MNTEKNYDYEERKDLPDNATSSERLKFIKNLAIFNKAMFGSISYNDIQLFLDKVIEVCNDK